MTRIHDPAPRLGSMFAALLVLLGYVSLLAGDPSVQATERGAVVETDRYRVEFRDGVLVSLINHLTGEEYLDSGADLSATVPHVPSGLGTQHGEPARAAAERLYHWPWWEHPNDLHLPNQHYADATSDVACQASKRKVELTYTNLTDGQKRFPDETFSLVLEVDPGSGDLLITPGGVSPRPGVYAANLTLAPLASAVTAEAPITDGLHITRDNTGEVLWMNKWPDYWQYGFVAFNGWKRGAAAIWAQDEKLRYYKHLMYLKNEQGLSFALSMMNVPPFEKLKQARNAVPWRLQVFDKSWMQGVTRYHAWREQNLKMAPRPEFTKQISFIASIAGSQEQWLEKFVRYTKPWQHRAAAFLTTVRKQQFDRNHADNTPHDAFKSDTQKWHDAGTYGMAYLQPMIMWGPFPDEDKMTNPEREKMARELHRQANTRSAFQKNPDTVVQHVDQHHLGHPGWQRWFLDWVKEWCRDYGAQGIYHDQSYHAPLDRRGLAVGGMTAPEGLADYFHKAATENPGTFHGTEMVTECNAVAVANAIGSGYHWGTAPNMRLARAYDASPITAALAAPHTVLWSFVRLRGDSVWDLRSRRMQEARGQIAGAIDGPFDYRVDPKWFPALCNTPWHDRTRDVTFLKYGLRPRYPADYRRDVLSYFTGADGEDFRYEKTAWGSRFVQVLGDGSKRTVYAVATGVQAVPLAGVGIQNWLVYNDDEPNHTWNRTGPAGLHPERFYVLDPTIQRPPVYFSTNNGYGPSFYEAYVEDSAYNEHFAFLKLRTIADLRAVVGWERLILHSPTPPKAVYVNGKRTALKESGTPGEYPLSVKAPADIIVILKDPPSDLSKLHQAALARVTEVTTPVDYYRSAALREQLDGGLDDAKRSVVQEPAVSPFGFQFGARKHLYVPIAAPPDSKGGVMRIHLPKSKKYGRPINQQIAGVELNFQAQALSHETEAKVVIKREGTTHKQARQVRSGALDIPEVLEIPLAPGEVKLLSIHTHPFVGRSYRDCERVTTKLALEWIE